MSEDALELVGLVRTWPGPRLGQSLPVLPLVPLASPGLVAVRLLRALCRLPRLGELVAQLVRPVCVSLDLVIRDEGLCT